MLVVSPDTMEIPGMDFFRGRIAKAWHKPSGEPKLAAVFVALRKVLRAVAKATRRVPRMVARAGKSKTDITAQHHNANNTSFVSFTW